MEGYAECCIAIGVSTFDDIFSCIFPTKDDNDYVNGDEKFDEKEGKIIQETNRIY